MDKDGGDLLMRRAKPYSEALEETVHTVFRHRCSIKDDLGHVKDEGKNDGNLHSFERPDVDTLDAPRPNHGPTSSKGSKRGVFLTEERCLIAKGSYM